MEKRNKYFRLGDKMRRIIANGVLCKVEVERARDLSDTIVLAGEKVCVTIDASGVWKAVGDIYGFSKTKPVETQIGPLLTRRFDTNVGDIVAIEDRYDGVTICRQICKLGQGVNEEVD